MTRRTTSTLAMPMVMAATCDCHVDDEHGGYTDDAGRSGQSGGRM